MVTDPQFFPGIITGTNLIFKIGFLSFSVLYFIFSLLIIRQSYLMTEIIETEGGSLIRALTILHSGLALGIIVLLIGFL